MRSPYRRECGNGGKEEGGGEDGNKRSRIRDRNKSYKDLDPTTVSFNDIDGILSVHRFQCFEEFGHV